MTTPEPAAKATSDKIILSCANVWKVFGPNADRIKLPPTTDEIAAANLIAGVRDASLDICEGEIFIIMGLSGSGKSTLVRCLSRLVEPTLGSVTFDGQSLLDMSDAELKDIRRHRMGMVFQNFALLPHLTVLGNVAFPLEIQGLDKMQGTSRALEMIRLVGLEGRENYYPRELSGGQQQRVGIARSLAVEPDIWFLDEPFSALDPLIRREMQDEFLRLQKALHKTIVFITHDFDEAVRLADRIAIMKDGKIVQVGTPQDLLLTPATAYVREFTKSISRSQVLSVETIMKQGVSDLGSMAPRVNLDMKINEAAAVILASD
jgi:glycine betaine/proline transport system ATP-binding protein